MKMKARSVQQIVQDQVKRWQIAHAGAPKTQEPISVITISREPGSGGNILAERLGDELGYDVYHQKIIHLMAESTHIRMSFLEQLDEKGSNLVEDCLWALANSRHLWPDQYFRHLVKVIGSIGRHGHAVVVGRGANFILPPAKRLSVRVVAPENFRIKRVSRDFGVSMQEAKNRVRRTESDRKAFIRKYFNADVSAPKNYDMVIDTELLGIEDAVRRIKSVLGNKAIKQQKPVYSKAEIHA